MRYSRPFCFDSFGLAIPRLKKAEGDGGRTGPRKRSSTTRRPWRWPLFSRSRASTSWRKRDDASTNVLVAAILGALYWVTQELANFYPGVAWTDPEFLKVGQTLKRHRPANDPRRYHLGRRFPTAIALFAYVALATDFIPLQDALKNQGRESAVPVIRSNIAILGGLVLVLALKGF